MPLIAFLIALASSFLFFATREGEKVRAGFLKSLLAFCALLVIVTEGLSLFHALNRTSLTVAWTLVSAGFLALSAQRLGSGGARILARAGDVLRDARKAHPSEQAVMVLLALLMAMVAVQGLLYPINNNDSLTYHMPRIISWMSQGSVEHFKTVVYRQIYQPPFSEFFLMHLNMLAASDVLSNLVQLFFLLSGVAALSLLMERLSLQRFYTLVSATLLLTLPMALLQASNTKSDIILSFFILTSVHFSWECLRSGRLSDYLFLGISYGLAFLTRGTSYIFLLPLAALLGIALLARMVRERTYGPILPSALAVAICLLLNGGHYARNQRLTGHVLGLDATESRMYSNESMSAPLLVSNMLKNLGRQVGPYPINKAYDRFLAWIHGWMDVPLDNPLTNFERLPYNGAPSFYHYEENAPNFPHLYLFLAAVALLAWLALVRRRNASRSQLLTLGILSMQFILFSALLKWQPWGSRIVTPIFALSAVFVGDVFGRWGGGRPVIRLLLFPLIAFGFYVAAANRMRPLILMGEKNRELFRKDRFARQFVGTNTPFHREYRALREGMRPVENLTLGLLIDEKNIIYTLLRDAYDSGISPVYIRMDRTSGVIEDIAERPQCVVSNLVNAPAIELSGRRYLNVTPGNSLIWLYK